MTDPLMDRRQRLLFNFSVSYVAVSALLFAIFIFTYRSYFYRLQEQMVLTRARQNEEIFLNRVAESFRSAKSVDEARKETYEETMKSLTKIRLADLVSGLKVIENLDEGLLESPVSESPFIENDGVDSKERLKKLLKPVVSRKEVEKNFVEFFDKFAKTTEGKIEFRRFSNGLEQMVNMNFIYVDSANISLKSGTHDIGWEIRAYVVPKRDVESKTEEVLAKIISEHSFYVPRLGVYPYEGKKPLYVGKEHELDSGKLDYFEEKGLKEGVSFFNSPETFVVKGPYQGQEVQQHLMNSFLTDPSLGLTFVLHRVIYEPEWTQFEFFQRNKLPILLYVVLAWVVCPLLFWWGIRMSNKFQFNFTVDLEGDEIDTLDAVMGDRRRGKSSMNDSFPLAVPILAAGKEEKLESSLSEQNEDHELRSKNKTKTPSSQSNDTEEKKNSALFDSSKVGPLTRRLIDEGPVKEHVEPQLASDAASKNEVDDSASGQHMVDLMSSSQSDVEKIRQNNIRKSSQSYNRHESSDAEKEKDVDYLAGVQSDVLKSLIQKLRDE